MWIHLCPESCFKVLHLICGMLDPPSLVTSVTWQKMLPEKDCWLYHHAHDFKSHSTHVISLRMVIPAAQEINVISNKEQCKPLQSLILNLIFKYSPRSFCLGLGSIDCYCVSGVNKSVRLRWPRRQGPLRPRSLWSLVYIRRPKVKAG